MKVLSVNLSTPTRIEWNGKSEFTGIYKMPVAGPVYLGKSSVNDDTIADRKVHGGPHKACYIFSESHYPYWKSKYPGLDWAWGMFGENITMDAMDEGEVRIGNIYRVGGAQVQVSMPREPCYKLGIRFGSQNILKEFISYGYPGAYLRVLKEGWVRPGDQADLMAQSENPLTVRDCFLLYYARRKPADVLALALNNEALPQYKRDKLSRYKVEKGA